MKNRETLISSLYVLKQKKMELAFVQYTVVSVKKCSVAIVFLQVNLFVALERDSVSIKIMSLGR